MAIRDIVTMGFGNGVFSPGVSKVVTMGYAIGDAVPDFGGIACFRDETIGRASASSEGISKPAFTDESTTKC